jgi:aspartokinase
VSNLWPEVWKFGGASLADGKAILRAADQIAGHRGPLVVVASALAGVTDLLLQGATDAAFGRTAQSARAAKTFRQKHEQVLRDLLDPPKRPKGAKADHSGSVRLRSLRELRRTAFAFWQSRSPGLVRTRACQP